MQTQDTTKVREGFWDELAHWPEKYVHIVMIATKPDIIKQAPLYLELKKRGERVVLIHTGQHYDYNLSKGVLDEFHMTVDIELNITGKLHEKFSQIIDRLGTILLEISEKYGKTPIPYVHGDTLTATTADKAAFLNKFSVVHVEAGIRTFTPNEDFYHRLFIEFQQGVFQWDNYYRSLQNHRIYELGSLEPFPEQFDTRGVAASTGFFAIPHELYLRTLVDEGFPEDRMMVVGNTISDAVLVSQKKSHASHAFQLYPNMRGKKFIFITIHRRENCEVEERFRAIFMSIKGLVQEGYPVCFLGLHASEAAIDRYQLRKELDDLIKKYPESFAYGPALAHHHEVIDILTHAGCVMTDSGSMQEEANIVSIPCVTVRFGSDRSETLIAGANVLAPPVNARLIKEITKGAYDNPRMRKGNIYGSNVSEKIVDAVLTLIQKEGKLFRLDHERLGLQRYFDDSI